MWLLVAALLCSSCAMRAWSRPNTLAEGCHETRDLAYWEGDEFDDAKHRLDVYTPKGEGPHPVVVFVHGGGWVVGDRRQPGENYVQLGRRLASQGILAMVISYRLAPWSQHPAQIRDTSRALAWALQHAPEHGGDPSAVYAMGHSAGAHLVALAACDPKWLREWGASPSQLAGVIGISGPYDVEHLGNSLLLGGPLVIPTFGRDKSVWRDVMPARHLKDAKPPPFFIAWADGDPEILRRDGRRFVEALEAAHVPVKTYETTFDDHLSIITDFADDQNGLGEQVAQFVQQRRLEIRQLTNR
ncbi:MAG: alpha/beta hydrolase [Myxococcaceae bacterium]|nr:alpha/beta hydrolase [Myxococcaceae bacterium]